MNILITGANGFVGKSFHHLLLETDHNVIACGHKELDLLNLNQLKQFFEQHEIDCVINGAFRVERRHTPVTAEQALHNIIMSENLLVAAQHCQYLINMAAASDFDIKTNVSKRREDELFDVVPTNYGSFMKNVTAKRTLTSSKPLGVNLRFAACFGYYEKADRFFKTNIANVLRGDPIIINQNRVIDFIYIEDLVRIAQFVLHVGEPRDINCAYIEKYTLVELAHILMEVAEKQVPVIIEKAGMDNEYTLDVYRLYSLNIPLVGLKNGIAYMYETMRRDLVQ